MGTLTAQYKRVFARVRAARLGPAELADIILVPGQLRVFRDAPPARTEPDNQDIPDRADNPDQGELFYQNLT